MLTARHFREVMTHVLVMIVFMLSFSGICLAVKPESEIRLYVDSIRNENTVYSESEAGSLLSLLENLNGNVPEDSLRLYAAEGLLNYNWFLVNRSEWFICRRLLDTAERLCPDNNEGIRQQIAVAKAGLYFCDGQYTKAEPIFVKACEYFRQHKDTAEWLKQCVNLGLLYNRTHNKAKVLEYYGKVLKVADNKKYDIYYSIVTGYAEKLEEDSIIGLATFQKALDISISNGYTFLLASNYNNLAKYHYRLENYREAMLNARKALKYSEQFNDNASRLTALGIMADIYYLKKDYVAAYATEEEINKLKATISEESDTRIYAHLAYTDSLISWADTNLPPIYDGQMSAADGKRNLSIVTIIILILIIAAISAVLRIIYLRRKNDNGIENVVTVQDIQEQTSPEQTPPEQPSDETCRPRLTSDAIGVKLIASGYNSMLDRIRATIKDIPKTGNADVDSRIRTLSTDLLQSRLPELSGKFIDAVATEEDNFTERLRKEFPALTRNDLRMALYIRGGLSLHEICSLTGVQAKSANQARYRLRKSLGLLPNESLEAFIMAF